MRVLVLGGTGFIGPHIVGQLVDRGHQVAVFHRGLTAPDLPGDVQHIIGDRDSLLNSRGDFEQYRPDVVVDVIAASEQHSRDLVEAFRGLARRTVVLSSGDVYRAHAILGGKIDGPVDPIPLTEDSPLRTELFPYRDGRLPSPPWADLQTYEKILVERVALSDASLPATILRLPFIYGPGEYRRFYPYIKRMLDARPFILLDRGTADWIGPWGYVANKTAAVVCAVEQDAAAGRVYNVADDAPLTMSDWVGQLMKIAEWPGRITVIDRPCPPPNLSAAFNTAQHMFMSSSRIRQELGYTELTSRDEALRTTIDWARLHPPEQLDPAQYDYAAEDELVRD